MLFKKVKDANLFKFIQKFGILFEIYSKLAILPKIVSFLASGAVGGAASRREPWRPPRAACPPSLSRRVLVLTVKLQLKILDISR